MARPPTELTVTNPFTGEQIGSVAHASVDEVGHAVATALDHLPAPTPAARAAILERAAALVAARRDELALTIAAEAGKPLKQAQVEAARCVDTLTFAADEARTLSGEMVRSTPPRRGPARSRSRSGSRSA